MVGLAQRFVGTVDAESVMRTDESRKGSLAEQAMEEATHINDLCVAAVARMGAQLGKSLGDNDEVTPRDCVVCDNQIPDKRRRAAPNARRCARCQSLYENTK